MTNPLPKAGFSVRLGKLGFAPPASRPAMRVPIGCGVGLSFVFYGLAAATGR